MAKSKRLNEIKTQYIPFEIEEEVLSYWKKNHIFEKSITNRPADQPYSFYDGPPFITGLPHYGHLLGSIVKDVIPRYQTMKGKRVRRVWGWDCHGLPAENKVEKQLGINSKKEIETLGIDKFISACKNYVNNVSQEWEWYIDHIGRWVDFKNSYKTMDLEYMESVLWVFKQLYDAELIYQGKRTSLFCPRCSTPISNFEVAMDNSYKDVTDPSVFVKFKVKGQDAFLLAWTTTPWTLPSNFALAVDPDKSYLKILVDDQTLILAKDRLKTVVAKRKYRQITEMIGKDLVGLLYEPLFEYYPGGRNDYQVYPADFVSMEEGTGIVHIAPGFGEDDTKLGAEYHLTSAESVDEEGKLDLDITVAGGKFFKSADKPILEDLKQRGLIFRQETIVHSYPHCHRCETPLLYKSQEAWFIDIERLRVKLLKTNENINWIPKYFKHGRFKLGIENAPDWCISRSRYWGTPLPVWRCDQCSWRFVPGSIKELEQASGKKVTELHRPDIDQVTVRCQQCQGTANRVPEVLDSWLEAASMPYAERHYPFENQTEFKASFPADFITEYTGQLRAWFYVMHVVSNGLFQTHSFKNCLVTGVILGTDGRKMSKNFGNYPDPRDYIKKYGADALRLYLMGSPIVSGKDISISETDWQEQLKTSLMILWNSYKFFVSYASLDDWQQENNSIVSANILDRWILVRLNQTVAGLDKYLSQYQLPKAVALIRPFINDLSTWYIRRSRDRVSVSAEDKKDKQAAFATMHQVFVTFLKSLSPFTPFISEYLYRHLTGELSVHLADWPEVKAVTTTDLSLLEKMELVRRITEQGHGQRKKHQLAVKQPLKSAEVSGDTLNLASDQALVQLIKDELNIESVVFKKGKELAVSLDTKLTDQLIQKGKAREIVRSIQEARKAANCRLDQLVDVVLPAWPKEYEDQIKREALVKNIIKGSQLAIKIGD
ncbi:isoleucine--tRNA ligase [Candidatus Collierbacteria bacterium]|nr:isoleucine--tRNA ligase [Candidatus Collierbacteria bacterium]